MNINPNTWYAVWFRWSCGVLDRAWPMSWNNIPRVEMYQRGTNLCHFLRTMMLGTIVALMSAATWLYFITVITVVPVYLYGATPVLVSMGALVFMILVAGVVVWLLSEVFPKVYTTVKNGTKAKISSMIHVAQDQTPSFLKLLMNHLVAVKQKYCPTIGFNKDTKQ